MTVWLLVFVLFTKDGPLIIDHPYGDRFDCEVHEGLVATAAQKDMNINGWSVPVDCVPVPEAKKV